ncbi:SOS response-associated peptidase [soil metagenome]
MCNLYSMTTNQEAIRRLFKITRDSAGNMPPLPGIFPDRLAPVVRRFNSDLELAMMRWGMPNPPGAKYGQYSTNIRNAKSPHWRRWLKPESRCLVPATSFSEYAPEPNPATGKKDIVWFALSDDRPTFAFAGIWTDWTGTRGTKAKPEAGDHRLFAFLTTEPNAVVAPIHPKAMPVILRPDDWDTWLNAPADEAMKLQQPWPDDGLKIVKRGPEKEDAFDPNQPSPEDDYGGGDIVSLESEPSTDDDQPL